MATVAWTLVVLLHLAFVAFATLGGLLALRWKYAPLLHLPAAVWGLATELLGLVCPLTPLENRLRLAAGRDGYQGGFVEHTLVPILYPQGLTREAQWVLAALLLLTNVAVYGWVLKRRRGATRL